MLVVHPLPYAYYTSIVLLRKRYPLFVSVGTAHQLSIALNANGGGIVFKAIVRRRFIIDKVVSNDVDIQVTVLESCRRHLSLPSYLCCHHVVRTITKRR